MLNSKISSTTVFYVFAILFLASCATTPKDAPNFSQAKAASPDSDKALLYIYRAYAEPTAYNVKVMINGQKIADIANEGFTYTYLNEGQYTIDIVWPAISAQKDVRFESKLEGGKTYFYEVKGISKVTGISGGVISSKMGSALFQIANKDAEARVQACCRYIASKGHSYYPYNIKKPTDESSSSSPDTRSTDRNSLPAGKLNKSQIEKVFSGYSVEGHHHRRDFDFVRYYAKDGSLTGNKNGKKTRRGTWRATSEGLCVHWDGKDERCRPIYNDNGTIRKYIFKDGEKIMVMTYSKFVEGNSQGF